MNDLTNKKILVIGGAGFIGSFVVSELLKEDVAEVVVYDNFARGKKEYLTEQLKDPRCSIFPIGGDIRDIDILDTAMKGKDYVISLAAMWLLHCKDYPRTAFEVNIAGTFNVFEACVKNNIKKLIWSSSASVYGDAVELPMTESHPFNNKNFYGATKIAGEAMATAFNDRYGLKVIGLRYMNVYGPHQDQTAAYTGVVPIMLNKIEANESPVINGDGSHLGLKFSYKEQPSPDGLAQAFILGEEFIGDDNVCLVLGDNIFYGAGLQNILTKSVLTVKEENKAVVFGYYVEDPERYGVAEVDADGNVLSIEEKPKQPKSNYAVVGLYFYPNAVVEIAKNVKPSQRGELEITSVNEAFLQQRQLKLQVLSRGFAWLDTGTHEALSEATEFVKAVEKRTSLKIACIEEIAYKMGFIDKAGLQENIVAQGKSSYADYLKKL